MWVECTTQDDRAALVKHFDGFQCALITGRQIICQAFPVKWLATALTVECKNISPTGIRNLQDALETTELGLRLYGHLKCGPSFRFARVAWEAEYVQLAELSDYLVPMMPGECRLTLQCVVDEALYKQLGSPQFFSPFRPGYLWTRYYGESYKPLCSSDQPALNDLCRSIFPEYFKYKG